jgi:predicted nucleic acid-binding protein
MTHYLFDACAVLSFIKSEPEAQKIRDLLNQARAGTVRLSMSIVQLLEVYYDCIYVGGEDEARVIVASFLSEPVTIIEAVSYDVMYEAGRFKTTYSMSLADCIAAATAKILGAVLVTKDDEMKPAEEAGEFSVQWLAK